MQKKKDTSFFLFQAIANESGINFISVKGPELLNMVGVNRWFSPDVIAAMLVHTTKFSEFHSIIMQNMSHNLLLFCAPT